MPNTCMFNEFYPSIDKSMELYNLAKDIIPCVTQTLAKGPAQYTFGIAPIYLQNGSGCKVWDVDGNEYIDYTMGVGPLSLGYNYPATNSAIINQLNDGITFSLMHPLELKVAQLIREVVPNAEMVRFSKSGNDVTSAAIRLARAYTGKNTVLCCGYHGWHDWYISVTDRNSGIPQEVKDLTYTFNYNDFQSVLDAIDNDTAAIILEPVVFEEPKDDFLQKIREICTEKGIILIFDEMWTGFRMALGGAQEYFGIKADLATFSKAVANGMPISILTGRRDIMNLLEKEVFFFATFGGEALSLAAAVSTINEIRAKNVIRHLDEKGKMLKDGYNQLVKDLDINFTNASGYNFRSIINFNSNSANPLELKTLMQQELIKRGILWSGYHNMSFSHKDDDIIYTLKAYKEVLEIVKDAVNNFNVRNYIKGNVLEPVFRKVGNFNTKPKI